MKGWGKVYICIFDGPGLERGSRSTVHNKRKTKTTAWDKGTAKKSKKYKKSKKQNPATRKKQNLATRKKYSQKSFSRSNKVQSDAEILLDIQLRYETHGGKGFASPQKVILLCDNKTKIFMKNAKLGLKAVSMKKKKSFIRRGLHQRPSTPGTKRRRMQRLGDPRRPASYCPIQVQVQGPRAKGGPRETTGPEKAN